MRYSPFIALFVTLMLGGIYWYQVTAAVCPVPLSYRLGEVDSSFALTREEAAEHIKVAEAVWEEATERDLFVYDDAADFTIDFVFDERQAATNDEERARQSLDDEKAKNEELITTIDRLQADYDELAAVYQADRDAYESRLSEYNTEVTKYNDRGGAPSDIFAELEATRVTLNTEASKLAETADELNELVAEINRLGDRANLLVNQYNRQVETYNEQYGFAREFTQGDFQGDRINIYTFSSTAELETVLAHEFGHALGIAHVDEPSALMYYLMEEPEVVPILAEADVEAYYEVCGREQSFAQRIRHFIRQIL